MRGYSLIELVVVIGLTGILAIAITAVSMTSLISSTRIRNQIRIRQAGDSSINQLQKLIRGAKSLSCNSQTNTLTTINEDGNTTTVSAIIDGAATRIASNSGNYITPADTTISGFDITCVPNNIHASLINVKFGITSTIQGTRSQETPVLNYETNIQLRN